MKCTVSAYAALYLRKRTHVMGKGPRNVHIRFSRHWLPPNTRTHSSGLSTSETADVNPGQRTWSSRRRIGSSTETDCRLQPQDWTDDWSMAWESRKRRRDPCKDCCNILFSGGHVEFKASSTDQDGRNRFVTVCIFFKGTVPAA